MKMVDEMDPTVDCFGRCFQKKKGNRKVCFDCTGAYGLHVSPRHGAPKVNQNYFHKLNGFQERSFPRKFRKLTENDTQKVSKWVRVFRANVAWAPLGAPLVPQSVLEDENGHKVLPE